MFNITEQMLASEGYVDGPSASLKRWLSELKWRRMIVVIEVHEAV